MADSILCYAATVLVAQAVGGGPESKSIMDALRADPRLAHQFLLLAHLYARSDGWALAWLRTALLRPSYSPAQLTAAVAGGVAATAAGAAVARDPRVADAVMAPLDAAWDYAETALPPLRTHPKLVAALLGTLALGGVWAYRRSAAAASLARAAEVQAGVRVNRPQPTHVVASLLDSLFSRQEHAGLQ
ncbi:hypothetical protein MNEG_16240 [Monoraphidium neglectum]|uniref:Uncharacterized protein n=1 Tax=Monoraphidium neglectum TaxID=145388 RepID=A0A0D2LI75_9CHLO|nr:hypothetical protein MNEG_16240 [Monoraphidium neglectum]KIY91724.1 hypothetical protein MNEG_16240 [Monoraphidium neglectum]|eukprot:XP_013890744.1 hypothetical protein MNEG_16240 [Monoraphidium neglectum]